MRMKPIAATIVLASFLSAGIAVIAQEPRAANAKDASSAAEGRATLTTAVQDRGNVREIYCVTSVTSVNPVANLTFTGDLEIDVTSVSFAAVHSTSTTAAVFNAYLVLIGDVSVFPGNCYFTTPGTEIISFDPPVRVRAGDMLTLAGKGLPAGSVTVEAHLRGYVPSAVRGNGFIAN